VSLVEFARYPDVCEADLAAAFLEAHGIRVAVTERYQTTLDPLMQRALGIRILGSPANLEAARLLLARVQAGEFASEENNDIEAVEPGPRVTTTLMALASFALEGFWGNSLPRRLRAPAWQGMLLTTAVLGVVFALVAYVRELVVNPP
jgi:hypothetical protein